MKFILILLASCLSLAAANPPIQLNHWTTNVSPPVTGTNLMITNPLVSFHWKFWTANDPYRVATLMDITNLMTNIQAVVTNALGSVWTNDSAVVASGLTNIQFYGDGITASNDPVGNARLWFNYAETNEANVWHSYVFNDVLTNETAFGIVFRRNVGGVDTGASVELGDGIGNNAAFAFISQASETNLYCDDLPGVWHFLYRPQVGQLGAGQTNLVLANELTDGTNSAVIYSSNLVIAATNNLTFKADTNSPSIHSPTFYGVLRGDRLAGTADASTYIDVGSSQLKLYRLGQPVMISTNEQDALFSGTIISSYINSHPLSSILSLNSNTFLHTNGSVFMLKSNFIGGQLVVTGAVESRGIFYGDGSGLTNVSCTNAAAVVGVALSNTISHELFAMTNILTLYTNHWYYFTNVAWTNHTFLLTNVTAGTETRIYVKGGITNYTLTFEWPPGVVATWLSTTNDSMRSNRVTHINIACWDATNVVLVGKEAP